MYSTTVVLIQLLWLSLASASHFYGGVVTFNAKKTADGNFEVELRNKATFRSCQYQYGTCSGSYGSCGYNTQMDMGVIDSSSNGPTWSNTWCQTETVVTKILTSNKPFRTLESSCCWIYQYPIWVSPSWSVLTSVDLGTRSDTNGPNNSPDIAIIPFLRVPQNCRRSYRPTSFDRDGDVVQCRYGNRYTSECSDCKRQVGFQVDQASCTLHYQASGIQGVHEFELVVEDFPQNHVTLAYSDGSTSVRYRTARRKRWAMSMTTTTPAPTTTWPWWWNKRPTPPAYVYPTTATTTTTAFPLPTTAAPTTMWQWPWWGHTGPAPTAYVYPTTTTTTTTAFPLPTTAAPTTMWHWPWWGHTGPAPTAYVYPTTTTTTTITTTTSAATTAKPTPGQHWWYTTKIWPSTTTPPPSNPGSWNGPFSVLPLQFVFQVDPPVPSCAEGHYLPMYVPPTPRDGEVVLAAAGKDVELKVKAEALYSQVDDIIISGPLNITKHRTTGDVFTIRWTPIQEDIGHYFPICFVVEFKSGYSIYQTEMRCVLVNVTGHLVNTVVTCQESAMVVEVEKATLPRLHYEHLRLSDPSNTICSLQTHSNSTHVVAIVPLNACGTEIEEDDTDLLFKNEITTVDNASAIITRRHQLEIKFFCQYSKRGNVTATFSAHRENVTVWDKGFGQFTYGFEFYPDQQFVSRMDPRLYPLEYDVGDRIYMEIDATTTVNNTELFVETCTAAPYDNPNYPHPYTIIENGCNIDPTLLVYARSHDRQFKFSIEAFKFIGLHDQVYISCSVLMCEAGNPHTRCSRGCQHSGPRRSRREAAIETGTHYVSQGPLRLKRSVETGNTGLNLNLNLVFITGCVLAAVGMICAVLFYKAKKTSVKYQLLSSTES